MTLLWLTAMIPAARPPACSHLTEGCKSATKGQMTMLLFAFSLMSIGNGGRSCSLAFGVDQVNRKDYPNNHRVLEIFFSWYYAFTTISVIIALTVIVYIQDHLGWKIGFGVPAALMLLSTLLFFFASPLYVKITKRTSLFTGFAQVTVAAYKNRKLSLPTKNSPKFYHHNKDSDLLVPTDKLRYIESNYHTIFLAYTMCQNSLTLNVTSLTMNLIVINHDFSGVQNFHVVKHLIVVICIQILG
jgi:peptide/histidine transporter 3/4